MTWYLLGVIFTLNLKTKRENLTVCIILYKPKGAALPTKKTLQICFANNDDGAGLTVIKENCRSRKGFMKFQDLWAAYRNECFTVLSEFAIHFRLATAGGISKGNCHPFPIKNNVWELRQRKFRSDQVIMHNGILGAGSYSLSDTMLFIKDELYALRDHLKDPKTVEYIKRETWGSKLLIIDCGKVTLTGGWITDKITGIKYSNSGYLAYDLFSDLTDNGEISKFDNHNDQCWVDRGGGLRACVKSTDITASSSDAGFINNLNDYDDYDENDDDLFCPECLNMHVDFIEPIVLDRYPNDDLYECYLCDTIFDSNNNVFVEGCDMSDNELEYYEERGE